MDKITHISKLFLQEAKAQYRAGEISLQEYEEILVLIYEKLSDIEGDCNKKEFVLKTFKTSKINLKSTITFALALN